MKNPKLSVFTLKLLILFAVIALYVNFVYFPLDKEIKNIVAERRQAEEITEKYLYFNANRQLLDERIADFTAQTEVLNAKKSDADPQKIVDSISAMLVQSETKAQSIVVGDALTLDTKSADGRSMLHAVSIHVILTADIAGSSRFISALEEHPSGAFSVDSMNYSEKEQKLSVLLTMRYFAPEDNKK